MPLAYKQSAAIAAPLEGFAWWPVAVGLAVLYGLTYVDMARKLWTTEEGAHGPLVVAVAVWLIWRSRRALRPGAEGRFVPGLALLLTGLLCYVVGRSQGVLLLECASQLAVAGGIVWAVCGRSALRALSFPLFFLLFAAPLPGLLVDGLTAPLKQFVSVTAEQVLYTAGYPVARDGVILAIGQYQLLVADACSGLHSLFSLTALGLLYVHLMAYRNRLHNGLLLASLVPIALLTNVVRVMLLVLVTYYFGDGVAQGFIHSTAGMMMFAIALIMLYLLDSLVRRLLFMPPPKPPR